MGNIEESDHGMDLRLQEKTQIDISVVMPVFNTGSYLEQSLNSLVNQTFQNFELICVDDFSSDDRTLQILREYRNKYEFMEVIFLKENVGAGEARNIGFRVAKGTYVIFLDADDIFYKNMLQLMYDRIREEDADVCICGYVYFHSGKEMERPEKIVVSPRKYDKSCPEEDWLLYNSPNPWTKLCKRSFLEKNKISFQSLPACNDVYWSCIVQIKASKVCFVEGENVLVYYRTGGLHQITAKKSVISIYDAMAAVVKELENEDSDKAVMTAVILLFIWLEIGEIRISKDDMTNKKCHQATREFLFDRVGRISYKSEFYSGLLRSFMQQDFLEKRFPYDMSFLNQITLCTERLLTILDHAEKRVLWGNGNRGEAFQQFCRCYSISLWGVTDKKDIDIHQKTKYGYPIIRTEDVLGQADMIIAGNAVIFDFLREMIADRNVTVINLQDFCPLC